VELLGRREGKGSLRKGGRGGYEREERTFVSSEKSGIQTNG
jgi:hypothetical protein